MSSTFHKILPKIKLGLPSTLRECSIGTEVMTNAKVTDLIKTFKAIR